MPVYRYTLKSGATRWGARVNVKDLQAKRRGFRTREQAEDWYARKRREFLRATASGHEYESDITVAELAERWLEHKARRVKPSTLDDYRRQLTKHILPALGERKVGTVTTYELQDLLDGLATPRLTNKCRVVLRAVFRTAQGWGIVEADPTRPLTGLKESRRKPRFLTYEEAQSLLTHLPGQHRLIALLALGSGMRIGGILAPRYEDVKPGHINVERTYSRGRTGSPKSARPRRVAIPGMLNEAVRKHHTERGNPPTSSLIFTREDGSPLEIWHFSDRLETAAKRTGIPHVRPHDLRHTHAAWLLSGGVNPKFVSDQLGHSTIAITMNIYGHLLEHMEEGFREWFAEKIGNFSETFPKDSSSLGKAAAGQVVKFPGKRPEK